MSVFEKITFYEADRFFGSTWPETKQDFLEVWVPAQNRAADAGLAPRVLFATAENEVLVCQMEKIEGVTLLDLVYDWRNDPTIDDEELIRRLTDLLQRAEDFHRQLYEATSGGHPDWAARNVMQRTSDGRWFAIDFENWCRDETYEPEPLLGGVFASDLAQSFHHSRRIYNCLMGKQTRLLNCDTLLLILISALLLRVFAS
jgi:hypothetical protein